MNLEIPNLNHNDQLIALDISSIAFYFFLALSSLFLIFDAEFIPGQIEYSLVIAFLTILLSYPMGGVLIGLRYKSFKQLIGEGKYRYISFALGVLLISVGAIAASLALYKLTASMLLFTSALLQIFFFIRNDFLKNHFNNLGKLLLFFFIGIFFGAGISNMLQFLRFVLQSSGILLPLGNPIIGVWGLIYYSFSVIWLVDKENKISNYLFEKRLYIWILAGIMLLFIVLGGNKQHL